MKFLYKKLLGSYLAYLVHFLDDKTFIFSNMFDRYAKIGIIYMAFHIIIDSGN